GGFANSCRVARGRRRRRLRPSAGRGGRGDTFRPAAVGPGDGAAVFAARPWRGHRERRCRCLPCGPAPHPRNTWPAIPTSLRAWEGPGGIEPEGLRAIAAKCEFLARALVEWACAASPRASRRK